MIIQQRTTIRRFHFVESKKAIFPHSRKGLDNLFLAFKCQTYRRVTFCIFLQTTLFSECRMKNSSKYDISENAQVHFFHLLRVYKLFLFNYKIIQAVNFRKLNFIIFTQATLHSTTEKMSYLGGKKIIRWNKSP